MGVQGTTYVVLQDTLYGYKLAVRRYRVPSAGWSHDEKVASVFRVINKKMILFVDTQTNDMSFDKHSFLINVSCNTIISDWR